MKNQMDQVITKNNAKEHVLIKQQIEQNNKTTLKCTIGKYQYLHSDYLGQGFSSIVYKANVIAKKRQKFAIKVIDLSKFTLQETELLETEIKVISQLNHPNVIKCLDVYKTLQNIFIVTEYCPHGDLNELIRFQHFITQDKAIVIMKQILEGYKYLMSKKIIHRDLKPANIMRFGNNWKIGDFGFAKYCKEDFVIQKIYVGSPSYMPPQALQFRKYSHKSDFFALGIMFYEVLTGETPWSAKDQKQLLDFMKQTTFISPKFIVSQQIRYFLQKCIVFDFYQRMSKDQFLKFSLDNIDIQRVQRTRPGKSISSAIKTSIYKSGKKSCIFTTPLKPLKNNLFYTSAQKITEKSDINNKQLTKECIRQNLNVKFLKNNDYYEVFNCSSLNNKIYKQNMAIINNQVSFVKLIRDLINNTALFDYSLEQEAYFGLLMYLLAIKILRMLANSTQNSYKLNKLDTFKQRDQYKNIISQISTALTKLQSEYKKFKNSISIQLYQKFNEKIPQLVVSGPMTFKTYRKVFQRLCNFVRISIIKQQNKMGEEKASKKCYQIKSLIEIMKILKNRISREHQIKGYGLKSNPQCLLLKNESYSFQDLNLSLKQLQNVSKFKYQFQ